MFYILKSLSHASVQIYSQSLFPNILNLYFRLFPYKEKDWPIGNKWQN
jgi:hypothetical protein